MKFSTSYSVQIQFLGFRFHGWQKQPGMKTVHEAVDKTLQFVLNNTKYKTLGVGRTDAKVSAANYIFQLFTDTTIDIEQFVIEFNRNAPQDVKVLSIKEVPTSFNCIQASKIKEYLYFFSFGEKNHPFAAPLLVGFEDDLDIGRMKTAAKLFEGDHYFHKYCTKPSEKTIFKRRIETCEIVKNDLYTANFFPELSYILRVKGQGFLRYQIRLMMGALFDIGKGNLSLDYIENSLKETNDKMPLTTIAPGSGLQLYSIHFKK